MLGLSLAGMLVLPTVLFVDPDGLITITGGKWTTYRRMAQDTIDAAIKAHGLQPKGPCVTNHLKLLGAQGFHEALFAEVRAAKAQIALLAPSSSSEKYLCHGCQRPWEMRMDSITLRLLLIGKVPPSGGFFNKYTKRFCIDR